MTFEDIDRAFTPPAATDLISYRSIPGTLFAAITSDAISSVEVLTISDSLYSAIAQAPAELRHFVLDLEQVGFINSEAISMLVTLHSAAKNRQAKLILAGVSKPVAEVFVVSKLQNLLTICMTPAQLEQELR